MGAPGAGLAGRSGGDMRGRRPSARHGCQSRQSLRKGHGGPRVLDATCRAVGSHCKLFSDRGTESPEGYWGPRPGLRTDVRQVSKVGAANGSQWGSLEGGRSSGLGMTDVRVRPAPRSLGFHSLAH